MCYGGLDPRYMMRDIEARLKEFPVAKAQPSPKEVESDGWITVLLRALRHRIAGEVS
jgi:hypothetical protein